MKLKKKNHASNNFGTKGTSNDTLLVFIKTRSYITCIIIIL